MSFRSHLVRARHATRRRWMRFVMDMTVDGFVVATAVIVALLLAFDGRLTPEAIGHALERGPLFILVGLMTLGATGLYFVAPRYLGLRDFLNTVLAGGLITLSGGLMNQFMGSANGEATWLIPVLVGLLSTAGFSAYRVSARMYAWRRARQNVYRRRKARRTLIAGAGDAADLILRELQRMGETTHEVIGLVDDDPEKRSLRLHGVSVLGGIEDIPVLADRYGVEEVLIAMPSADGEVIRRILDLGKKADVRVQTLPGIATILSGGKELFRHLREVEIEDLLRRDAVTTDLDKAAAYIKGEHVLVTGGGGSIGSELARQIARLQPASLILVGKGENSIYEIEQELIQVHSLRPISVIADVRDRASMEAIFRDYRPSIVFHAAAHKHVPLMQSNPIEAIRNNVLGTWVAADLAIQYGTKRFIYVSTDKAVNPTSIMGASKRVGEMIVSALGRRAETSFAAVRFGNVLGSRGSLIPMLKAQIKRGGPVTVTHPDMQRYFMTIPEAVQLIVHAGSMGARGEIFILDMGEPVRIVDLAEELIRLHGLVPGEDVQIQFIGARPGEKLFEELVHDPNELISTDHPKVSMTKNEGFEWDWLSKDLDVLTHLCNEGNQEQAKQFLMEMALGKGHPLGQLPTGTQEPDPTPKTKATE